MFGANFFGQAYWGQGAAGSEIVVTQTVSATVSTTASITTLSIVNQLVTATITASASITKHAQRILTASVTATGLLGTTLTIRALNVLRGITKFLTPRRTTRSLMEPTYTEPLGGLQRTTRRIRED